MRRMWILGIESSCDETGLALYHDQRGLVAHAVHSQIDLHQAYGGVVPELASRDHVRRIVPLYRQVLAEAGIAVAPERACATADAAVAAAEALGFPVVLKILSPDILHKSEIGGVLLNVASASAVRDGFATLIERAKQAAPEARIEGVLVAKQLSGGVECILGIQRDPVFGPVAMFGLGGIFVEVMKDVVLKQCPFGEDVAEQMIRSIQGAPLLLGARGKPPVDVKALAVMLSRLSVFAHQAGERLQSIDLNPVFALPAGQGAYAADAVIEVLPAPAALAAGLVEVVAA